MDINGLGVLGAAAIMGIVLACVVLVLGAIISVLRSPLSGGMKLVWFVFVVAAPFVGSILWFLVGKRQPTPLAR